jgi:riboflavin synthase
MFTGIVETVGTVTRAEDGRGARTLRVDAPRLAALAPGDSVAVDGVCLTVERADAGGFEATAVAETLARTTLGGFAPGTRVNLERAATMERLFGGHIVQGHIDGTGTVVEWNRDAAGGALVVDLPADVYALCVTKGSITIDGVSLTIARVAGGRRIELAIVPHTLANTTMDAYVPGRRVNVEADIVAKYVREFVKKLEPADFE